MKWRRKDGDTYYYGFIIVFTVFIYYLRTCFKFDINIFPDQIGTFASAAKIAGLNWDYAITQAKYYGYGFFWIFAPAFKYINDSHTLYCFIYYTIVGFVSITACFIYYISNYYFDVKNRRLSCLLACIIATGYCQIDYTCLTNDGAVFCFFWLVVYLFIKVFDDTSHKKAVRNIIFLSLV